MVTGYASKRILKLVALLVGSQVLFLMALEYTNAVTVNWGRIGDAVEFGVGWLQAAPVRVLVSSGVMGVGFATGFAFGFYRA